MCFGVLFVYLSEVRNTWVCSSILNNSTWCCYFGSVYPGRVSSSRMAPDMFQLSILISYDSFERSTCYHRIIQVSDEIVIDFKFPRLFNTFFFNFSNILESEIPTFNLESQYNLSQFLSFDSNNDRRILTNVNLHFIFHSMKGPIPFLFFLNSMENCNRKETSDSLRVSSS